MTLRGTVAEFPLETILQLLAATSKTGQLEVRSASGTGALGLDQGRLVAAATASDVGEPALGAVFTMGDGDFEFVAWDDPPAANLSGDLDTLLDRAVEHRDRIIRDRELIPSDHVRFALSERAAQQGEVTLTADQWRTLLAINGERDVSAIAAQLRVGPVAALASLAELVRAGLVDVTEPPPQPPPPLPRDTSPAAAATAQAPPPVEIAAPAEPAASAVSTEWGTTAPEAPATARPSWDTPTPAVPERSWDSGLAPQSWEARATEPLPAAPEEPARPDAALNDALAERLTALGAEPAAPEAPADDRLAALAQTMRAAEAPAAPPPPPEPDLRLAEPAPPPSAVEPEPKKRGGLFGGLFKREEPAAAPAAPSAPASSTALFERAWSRSAKLAAFANALIVEYNSGQYGGGRIDGRMANILMRVDEQADPIDRPLPIVDDRIDTLAFERAQIPESESAPYLACLISIVHEDAARIFGKDKAKRGYRAAQQQLFGADASALSGPDVAGKLPKV